MEGKRLVVDVNHSVYHTLKGLRIFDYQQAKKKTDNKEMLASLKRLVCQDVRELNLLMGLEPEDGLEKLED